MTLYLSLPSFIVNGEDQQRIRVLAFVWMLTRATVYKKKTQIVLCFITTGFLNHCMENIFLDQTFWLTSLEDEGAGIQVLLNEESLNHIYRSLLLEEGL